jgi:hypothetical protein
VNFKHKQKQQEKEEEGYEINRTNEACSGKIDFCSPHIDLPTSDVETTGLWYKKARRGAGVLNFL